MSRFAARIAVCLALVFASAPTWARTTESKAGEGAEKDTPLEIPRLTAAVIDGADILDARSQDRLETLARSARAQQGGKGVQLQILTVPSLNGEAIEDYSIRVAEYWKLGTKGSDNGLLIVVSRDDRAVRIEVGGGLEGGLTDAQASRIIRRTIVPAFQARAYGDGLYRASIEALSAVGGLPDEIASTTSQPRGRRSGGFGALLFIIVMVLLGIFRGGGGRGGSALLMGAALGALGGGRRGGGGFGGGGGGWGGGGGGFSGGGSSGRW